MKRSDQYAISTRLIEQDNHHERQVQRRVWSAMPCLQAFHEEHERMRRETSEPLADPYQIQIERTAARLGRTPDDVRRLVAQWMIARPCRWLRPLRRRGLLRDIADFHRRGGKTALVSDYPARAKLDAIGIAHFFDVVIASDESTEPWDGR